VDVVLYINPSMEVYGAPGISSREMKNVSDGLDSIQSFFSRSSAPETGVRSSKLV